VERRGRERMDWFASLCTAQSMYSLPPPPLGRQRSVFFSSSASMLGARVVGVVLQTSLERATQRHRARSLSHTHSHAHTHSHSLTQSLLPWSEITLSRLSVHPVHPHLPLSQQNFNPSVQTMRR
jgi:hypothetical protein